MAASLREWVRGVRETALGFIYPEACQYCGAARATREEGYLCPGCRDQLRFIRRPFCERCGLPFEGEITTPFECSNCREMDLHFRYSRSVIAAEGMALELIHRYKYQRALWFEPLLGRLLSEAAAPVLIQEGWHRLVPVPLHPHKLAEREFNQAERLARAVGQATGLALDVSLVRRVEPTLTQTQLSRSERAANVRQAFASTGVPCSGQRLVLIDDVLTTGATTSACARVLLDAGAAEVCVWTLARGLLH